MNILFLLSEEDRAKVPSELLVENVLLRSDPEVQVELLLNDYDTCFITSNYARVYGSLLIQNIIQTFRLFTSTRIHYIINEEEELNTDELIPYLLENDIGNITIADIELIKLGEFQKLARMDRTASGIHASRKRISKEKLSIIKDELMALTDERVSEYMKQNKGKISDLIQGYIELLSKTETDALKIQALYGENQYLNKLRLENAGKLDSKDAIISMYKKDIKELRSSVLEYKDKIEDYNEQIMDSVYYEGPSIYLDDLAPPIIYFKEIEDIGFYNVFEALMYVFNTIYGIYTKAIILEKSSRHFYNPYAKDGYTMITRDTTLETVINNDKMVRYGNPTNLLKTISKPEFRTELLLIFDRVGNSELLVDAPYIQPYYIGNYRDVVETLDINDTSWISPYEGEWKNIDKLLNHKMMGEEQALIYKAFVSQHPLVKYIVNMVIEPDDDDIYD